MASWIGLASVYHKFTRSENWFQTNGAHPESDASGRSSQISTRNVKSACCRISGCSSRPLSRLSCINLLFGAQGMMRTTTSQRQGRAPYISFGSFGEFESGLQSCSKYMQFRIPLPCRSTILERRWLVGTSSYLICFLNS